MRVAFISRQRHQNAASVLDLFLFAGDPEFSPGVDRTLRRSPTHLHHYYMPCCTEDVYIAGNATQYRSLALSKRTETILLRELPRGCHASAFSYYNISVIVPINMFENLNTNLKI